MRDRLLFDELEEGDWVNLWFRDVGRGGTELLPVVVREKDEGERRVVVNVKVDRNGLFYDEVLVVDCGSREVSWRSSRRFSLEGVKAKFSESTRV